MALILIASLSQTGYPYNVETKEIEDLFERLAKAYGDSPEASKPIFTILVKITLQYREDLIAAGEKPLNVAETKEALDELLKVMQKKELPAELNPRIGKLVHLWHDEVKPYFYN